jgi:molybdate transport system ATP-binding protein
MIRLRFSLSQDSFQLAIDERIDARVTAVFGPSGAGKTTMLEAIAGLRSATAGELVVGERVLFDAGRRISVPPRLRRIGYVPQDVALFPHLSVRKNILYAARHTQASSSGAAGIPLDRVLAILEITSLVERESVLSLSGGERQRVAIARALMSAPSLLLLDEPLAAVDEDRRRRIASCLTRVRDELAVPLIYVTHDADEIRAIADWVLVLERGRVVAAGPPARILM